MVDASLQTPSAQVLALHEAAHAVIAHTMGYRIKAITLGEAGGSTEVEPKPVGPSRWVIALAGGCAQRVSEPDHLHNMGAAADYRLVLEEIGAHVSTLPVSDQDAVANVLEDFADDLCDRLVRSNWGLIETLARNLSERRRLSHDEVELILCGLRKND